MKKTIIFAAAALFTVSCTQTKDIIIIGGGASGCSASLSAARLGCKVLTVEELPWIGGMLTSAGVSAVDGNYNMRSGIFGEFEQRLADYYGGWDKLRTAWVSNVMYEPHVGEMTWEEMLGAEKNIDLRKETGFVSAEKLSKGWKVTVKDLKTGRESTFRTKVMADCTELGDVAKELGLEYRLGFDAKSDTGEKIAYDTTENIVQDLTIVATLKDYGPGADKTIPEPEGYRMEDYANCCINPHNILPWDRNEGRGHDVKMMMTYGRLPGGKVMLNWPVAGNDIYLNIVDMTPEERTEALKTARARALGYVYFIQTALGLRNYGLADDEYPSEDGLALIPYHRESRRFKGEAFFILDNIERPYDYTLYRTGAAVGDYPVDHHHYAHPEWQRLEQLPFYPVPSYCLPAGVVVPLGAEDFLVGEKSVSVSNLANGTTRLQPVVTQIGQIVGTLAALSVKSGESVRNVSVRELQAALLDAGMYIQPLLDLPKDDPDFKTIQRISSTGIMRYRGVPFNWANQSWFDINEPARICDLYLEDYYGIPHLDDPAPLSAAALDGIIAECGGKPVGSADPDRTLTRLEAARAIDSCLHPFETVDINWNGDLIKRAR